MNNPQQPKLPNSPQAPYTYTSPSEQNADTSQPQTLPQYYKSNPIHPTLPHAEDSNSLPPKEIHQVLTGGKNFDEKNEKNSKKVDPLTTNRARKIFRNRKR